MQVSRAIAAAQGGPLLPAARGAASRRADRQPRLVVRAGTDKKEEVVTGVSFKPFEEVAPVLASTAETGAEGGKASFARSLTFEPQAEAALNEQINVEYTISYVYHAMSAYFDRDTVSLPGFAEYFRNSSLDERGHAQKLIDLQNTRGGRVKLNTMTMPETEFDHPEKGDALYAMELSLSLEKLNFDKLLQLWQVVDKHGDPQMTQYIEDMLQDQVEDIKKAADYVSQLRRVGKGHGVWAFDHELYEEEIRSRATSV